MNIEDKKQSYFKEPIYEMKTQIHVLYSLAENETIGNILDKMPEHIERFKNIETEYLFPI